MALKPLSTRQKQALKRHSVHHTKKHMTMMRNEMQKNGLTFTAAHKKAQKLVGR